MLRLHNLLAIGIAVHIAGFVKFLSLPACHLYQVSSKVALTLEQLSASLAGSLFVRQRVRADQANVPWQGLLQHLHAAFVTGPVLSLLYRMFELAVHSEVLSLDNFTTFLALDRALILVGILLVLLQSLQSLESCSLDLAQVTKETSAPAHG